MNKETNYLNELDELEKLETKLKQLEKENEEKMDISLALEPNDEKFEEEQERLGAEVEERELRLENIATFDRVSRDNKKFQSSMISYIIAQDVEDINICYEMKCVTNLQPKFENHTVHEDAVAEIANKYHDLPIVKKYREKELEDIALQKDLDNTFKDCEIIWELKLKELDNNLQNTILSLVIGAREIVQISKKIDEVDVVVQSLTATQSFKETQIADLLKQRDFFNQSEIEEIQEQAVVTKLSKVPTFKMPPFSMPDSSTNDAIDLLAGCQIMLSDLLNTSGVGDDFFERDTKNVNDEENSSNGSSDILIDFRDESGDNKSASEPIVIESGFSDHDLVGEEQEINFEPVVKKPKTDIELTPTQVFIPWYPPPEVQVSKISKTIREPKSSRKRARKIEADTEQLQYANLEPVYKKPKTDIQLTPTHVLIPRDQSPEVQWQNEPDDEKEKSIVIVKKNKKVFETRLLTNLIVEKESVKEGKSKSIRKRVLNVQNQEDTEPVAKKSKIEIISNIVIKEAEPPISISCSPSPEVQLIESSEDRRKPTKSGIKRRGSETTTAKKAHPPLKEIENLSIDSDGSLPDTSIEVCETELSVSKTDLKSGAVEFKEVQHSEFNDLFGRHTSSENNEISEAIESQNSSKSEDFGEDFVFDMVPKTDSSDFFSNMWTELDNMKPTSSQGSLSPNMSPEVQDIPLTKQNVNPKSKENQKKGLVASNSEQASTSESSKQTKKRKSDETLSPKSDSSPETPHPKTMEISSAMKEPDVCFEEIFKDFDLETEPGEPKIPDNSPNSDDFLNFTENNATSKDVSMSDDFFKDFPNFGETDGSKSPTELFNFDAA